MSTLFESIKQGLSEAIDYERGNLPNVRVNKISVSPLHTYTVDDGVSGTTFDRKYFWQMIQDIEDGKINCVIMKNLSRLGRNYIETGQYTDFFF